MDVDYNESYPIKSEVIVKETFSYCEKYEEYWKEELKTEPIDFEASVKWEEEDKPVKHTDIHGSSIHRYICNECNFITTEKNSLVEHLKISKNVQYFCKVCNFKTPLECLIKVHLRFHNTGDGGYTTKKCSFNAPQILPAQLKSPKSNEYICKVCDYETSREHNFKIHMTVHTGDEYKCNDCAYKTVRKYMLEVHKKIHAGNLERHMKIHTGNEYKCKECDYKTVGKGRLKTHMKIHTGNEYKCHDCDYKTVMKYMLQIHEKIHTGNEYKCYECDFKTVMNSSLKRHMKIHTDNQYKCSICDYKTLRNGCLIKHMQIHTDKELYKCNECEYKVTRKYDLEVHMKIHTGSEYKCNRCDYKTLKEGYLKKHLKIHTVDSVATSCIQLAKERIIKYNDTKYNINDFKTGDCETMLLNQRIYYLNKSKRKWISVGLYYPFEFASVVK
ncbi:hypothetical protein FQA39_LY00958 [Lamprigera yunnana]|nr:hypothetical protein FQA39_LY00958 [Lamprigera yunnana]